MDALTLPVRQGTPEWLATRRNGIGGSDAPIIVGESPYRSPFDLWTEKVGLVAPAAETDAMAWGRRLEPLVAAAYTEATGRRLRRVTRLLRNRERPWQLASIDREVVGERRLVEIKTTRSPRWDGADPVPGDVLAQLEHYLSVTGYDVADVAVLVGGSDLRVIEIGRDDAYIRDLIELEADFMHRVESRTAPPVDGSEATRRTLGRLHPRDDGTELAATPETDRLLADLRVARERATEAADRAATVENGLRGVMGAASMLVGPGYRVSFRKSADSARTDWQAVAAQLRPDPALVAQYTATREGPRVLRVTFGGSER
jgi:putative phage-type endonuclease